APHLLADRDAGGVQLVVHSHAPDWWRPRPPQRVIVTVLSSASARSNPVMSLLHPHGAAPAPRREHIRFQLLISPRNIVHHDAARRCSSQMLYDRLGPKIEERSWRRTSGCTCSNAGSSGSPATW